MKSRRNKRQIQSLVAAGTPRDGLVAQEVNNEWCDTTPVHGDQIYLKLTNLEGIFLILKLHPNPYWNDFPDIDVLKSNENMLVIKNEHKLNELFPITDAILMDLPSTTIIQAVATNKPVFALLKYFKYTEQMKRLLSKRVIWSEDEDELLTQVEKYIKSGSYPVDLNNVEFLSEYGTYLDNGKSAERAVSKVIHIINENLIK